MARVYYIYIYRLMSPVEWVMRDNAVTETTAVTTKDSGWTTTHGGRRRTMTAGRLVLVRVTRRRSRGARETAEECVRRHHAGVAHPHAAGLATSVERYRFPLERRHASRRID